MKKLLLSTLLLALCALQPAGAKEPASVKITNTHLPNPNSLEVLTNARVEPSLAGAPAESRYQFERTGYFCVDSLDSRPGKLVFNRTTSLRDTWAKIEKKK